MPDGQQPPRNQQEARSVLPCRVPGGGGRARLCRHLDLGPLASGTETVNFCWVSGAVEAGRPRHSGRSQRRGIAPDVRVLSGGLRAGTCPLPETCSLCCVLCPHAPHGMAFSPPCPSTPGPGPLPPGSLWNIPSSLDTNSPCVNHISQHLFLIQVCPSVDSFMTLPCPRPLQETTRNILEV